MHIFKPVLGFLYKVVFKEKQVFHTPEKKWTLEICVFHWVFFILYMKSFESMQVLKIFCIFVSSSCNRGNWCVFGGREVCKVTRASATTSHYYAVSSRVTEEIWAQQEGSEFPSHFAHHRALLVMTHHGKQMEIWCISSWPLILALHSTRMIPAK